LTEEKKSNPDDGKLDKKIKELENEIKNIQDKKGLGLVWDSEKVKVKEEFSKESVGKYPILKEIPKQILTNPKDQTNILIKGDNYHALSVLQFTHAKKIDVIYIDPPYNNGKKDWFYNNRYLDKKDTYRHSKWLSFMNNRLKLAKKLLADTGIICVTIDDNELPRLWMLMEKNFLEKNHLGTVVIRSNPGGRKSKRKVAVQHEYALFFSRTRFSKVAPIVKAMEEKSHNYKKDKEGWYEERNFRKDGVDSKAKENATKIFTIYYNKKTKGLSLKTKYPIEIRPIDTDGDLRIWRRDEDEFKRLVKKGDIFYKKTRDGHQVYFKFRGGLNGETPKSLWTDAKFSASEHGTQVLDEILGVREAFPFPKSPYAVAECIKVASGKKDAVILDFFAGSGTTGQAVLEMNKKDGGNRKFILVTNNERSYKKQKELEKKEASPQEFDKEGICEKICYPRLKKIMEGYSYKGKIQEELYSITPNISDLKDSDIIFSKIDKIKEQYKNQFDKVFTNLDDGTLSIIGEKKVSGKSKGLGGNLRYYEIEFINRTKNDENKKILADKSTEMLCLKEDCFEVVKTEKYFKIFKNPSKKYLGIIFDDEGIEPFKKQISKLDHKIIVYVFSLDSNARDADFKNISKKVELNPLPTGIFNAYRELIN